MSKGFNKEIKEYFNLPGINPSLQFDNTIEVNIQNEVRPEFISEQQYSDIMKKALIDECYSSLSHLISNESFNQTMSSFFYNLKNIDDLKEQLRQIKDKKWFLICNGLVGSILQDIITNTSNNIKIESKAGIYKIGTLYNNDIYVDPYLNFNFNKFSITFNDFLNYEINLQDNENTAIINYKKIESLSTIYTGNFLNMF